MGICRDVRLLDAIEPFHGHLLCLSEIVMEHSRASANQNYKHVCYMLALYVTIKWPKYTGRLWFTIL